MILKFVLYNLNQFLTRSEVETNRFLNKMNFNLKTQ